MKIFINSLALVLGYWANPVVAISTGTGFAITRDGYVVTNHHVIAKATKLLVRDTNGGTYKAFVVRIDRANDLALLKTDFRPKTPLPIGDSDKVRKGEHVFTIGYPMIHLQGLDAKLTDGVISSFSGIKGEPNSFQISVPVQPGNSGGPLINKSGLVVGVVVSKLSPLATIRGGVIPDNVNYAIKSNYLLELLRSENVILGKTGKINSTKGDWANISANIEPSVLLVITNDSSDEKAFSEDDEGQPRQPPPPLASSPSAPKAEQQAVTFRPLIEINPRPPMRELEGVWEELPSPSKSFVNYIATENIKAANNVVSVRQKTTHEYWIYVKYLEVFCSTDRFRSVREISYGRFNGELRSDSIYEVNKIGDFKRLNSNDPLLNRVCKLSHSREQNPVPASPPSANPTSSFRSSPSHQPSTAQRAKLGEHCTRTDDCEKPLECASTSQCYDWRKPRN